MIGAFVPDNEQAVIVVALPVENAGGVGDWIRACFDEARFAKESIKPTSTFRFQYDKQRCAIGQKGTRRGCSRLRCRWM